MRKFNGEPTAAHSFLAGWIRRHAEYPKFVHLPEVVAAFVSYDQDAEHHAPNNDVGRYVRRLMKECLELGHPVISSLKGYSFAGTNAKARGEYRRSCRRRAIALLRQDQQMAFAQEEERKRQLHERVPVQSELFSRYTAGVPESSRNRLPGSPPAPNPLFENMISRMCRQEPEA